MPYAPLSTTRQGAGGPPPAWKWHATPASRLASSLYRPGFEYLTERTQGICRRFTVHSAAPTLFFIQGAAEPGRRV